MREYRTRLLERATIQVGSDLLIFEPGEVDEAPEVIEELPDWALTTAEMEAAVEQERAAATRPVAPAVLRKVQAEARDRTRPHLLLRGRGGRRVFPLDTAVTTSGLGPVPVPVGESERGKEKVMAEVLKDDSGTFRVRAKGCSAGSRSTASPSPRPRCRPATS